MAHYRWLALNSFPYLQQLLLIVKFTSSTSSEMNIPFPYEEETGLQI